MERDESSPNTVPEQTQPSEQAGELAHMEVAPTTESPDEPGQETAEESHGDGLEPQLDDDEAPEGEEGEEMELVVDNSVSGFFDHTDSIYAVACHPSNPNLVVSGGGDDKAFLWDLTNQTKIAECAGFTDSVTCTAFSPDGNHFAVGSLDGTGRVYATATGEQVATLAGPSEGLEFLYWHPSGRALVAGSGDMMAYRWSFPGEQSHFLGGHQGSVLCGCCSSDRALLLTGSEDCTARVWSLKTSTCIQTFQGNQFHEAPILCVECYPGKTNSDLGATGGADHAIKLIHMKRGRILSTVPGHEDGVEDLRFSVGHPYLASASMDSTARVYDVSAQRHRNALAHPAGVVRVRWHPTLPLLATACLDHVARVWDGRTGTIVREFNGHVAPILDLAWTCDGMRIVTASDDKNVLAFALDQ